MRDCVRSCARTVDGKNDAATPRYKYRPTARAAQYLHICFIAWPVKQSRVSSLLVVRRYPSAKHVGLEIDSNATINDASQCHKRIRNCPNISTDRQVAFRRKIYMCSILQFRFCYFSIGPSELIFLDVTCRNISVVSRFDGLHVNVAKYHFSIKVYGVYAIDREAISSLKVECALPPLEYVPRRKKESILVQEEPCPNQLVDLSTIRQK